MNLEKPKLAVLALTEGGKVQALRLARFMACDCYTSDKLAGQGFKGFEGSMADCVRRLFSEYQALLFICATGITVRMIAPLVTDKLEDPAVLVMDERAQYVISLLSGHVGGANKLASKVAGFLGAKPVITTATDVNEVAALDTLIQEVGANVADYRQEVKEINQKLVNSQKIGLYLDRLIVQDTRGFTLITDLKNIPDDLNALVVVSNRTDIKSTCSSPAIQIIPKNTVLGIGCKRDTDGKLIYQTLYQYLLKQRIDIRSIKEIGSVIIKQNEQGLIQLASRLGVPFTVFSVEELQEHEHRFPISEFVQQTLGVGSVSQPAAWIMSNGHLLGDTLKENGITLTLGVKKCCI